MRKRITSLFCALVILFTGFAWMIPIYATNAEDGNATIVSKSEIPLKLKYDEEALANALNNKTIAGAALDVFSHEPLPESPLYHLNDPDALLASPHTAWAADDAVALLIEGIGANIKDFLLSLPR